MESKKESYRYLQCKRPLSTMAKATQPIKTCVLIINNFPWDFMYNLPQQNIYIKINCCFIWKKEKKLLCQQEDQGMNQPRN